MAEWDYALFWKETMNQTLDKVGEQEFTRWFTLIEYLGAAENKITLGVPSAFYRDQIKQRYQASLEATLQYIIGKPVSLVFEIIARKRSGSAQAPGMSPLGAVTPDPVADPAPPVAPRAATEPSPSEAPLAAPAPAAGTLRKTREPREPETPSLFPGLDVVSPEPVARKPAAPPSGMKKTDFFSGKERHTQLGEQYTFEKYIIGENNSFAANAAMAISRNLGTAYNPFLIYGGVGLGKTHLMQAIGHYIHARGEVKIIYTTAESFTNEFIQAVRENRMAAFKNKYRFIDLLLIDDIHFFENKWETQEELFFTFNSLYDANKQIVFTCDRPVSELKKITERLKSRFERGLNVDLQPPNYETRYAILVSKAQDRKLAVPDEVIALISKKISTNIRDLEAALTKLIAYAELVGKPITVDITQQLLKDAFAAPKQHTAMPIETILTIVADYFKLSPADLKGKKRSKTIAVPRQLAMYICREITQFSTTEIGQTFGGRDYSTVIHSCQKTEDQLRSDPTLDSIFQILIKLVKEEIAKA
ncbi:MAG: chromosomal replication initiator protein DnaA [Treponema sp.]|jgi:chromosomal replication initiator protein|nr:chromosomal replication initiator protein DnaA [Treponema sp.]